MRGYDRGGEESLEDIRALRNVDMVVSQGKVLRSPKAKKKQIVETELDKFL